MNREIKAKWVQALRSGEYKQARGELRKGDAFCCLGVLCDLHDRSLWDDSRYDKCYAYGGRTGTLPKLVREWAGLEDANPSVAGAALAEHNDGCYGTPEKSFTEIADLIEVNL